MRSGVEVYGRARGSLTRPDESAPVAPTSQFGRNLAAVEATANAIGQRIGVPVAAVRLGAVVGPHVPSPLGRLLRMPAVPFSVLADPAVRGRRGRRVRACVRRGRRAAASTSR